MTSAWIFVVLPPRETPMTRKARPLICRVYKTARRERSGAMDIAVLGMDLGKNSRSVVGLNGTGKVICDDMPHVGCNIIVTQFL